MKKWLVRVPSENGSAVTIDADRIFNDGRLVFINNIEGKHYGETVAAFPHGQWLYVKQLGDT